VSAIENAKSGLSVKRLQEIAKALDEPLIVFLERRETTFEILKQDNKAMGLPTGDWRDFQPLPIDPILASAIRAFVVTGYHGSTMRSIAQSADMSVSGLYHHYPTKQALLVKILDVTMVDLTWRLHQAGASAKDPSEAVEFLVEALTLFHAKRRDLAFIGASEMRSLEPADYLRIATQRDDVQRLLDTQIFAAMRVGDPKVPYPKELGRAVTSMCTSVAQWYRPEGTSSPEMIAARYGQFARGLLGGFLVDD
jgi:AcrR family transcriptional regulator